MKALPILVITNALALGLALILMVEQQDLKSQLGAARSRPARPSAGDPGLAAGAARERIGALERQLSTLLDSLGDPTIPVGDGAGVEPSLGEEEASGGSNGGGMFGLPPIEEEGELEPGEEPATDPRMELFRRQVRRANQLDSVEDRRVRVERSLDRLVEQNRIGQLDATQKKAVTTKLMAARGQVSTIWARLREDPAIRELPREERWQAMRTQYEDFRTKTQRELEKVVPAADAKVIAEVAMRDAGRGGGRPSTGGGGRSRGRGGDR